MKPEKTKLVRHILEKEWEMFKNVKNVGGKAQCQNDFETFALMRTAQLLVWGELVLASYLLDLEEAKAAGRNLMTEKYAFMMEYTHPDEYKKIRTALPKVSDYVKDLARTIVDAYREWEKDVKVRYPKLRSRGRQENASGVVTVEQYMYCELLTYSERTLVYMIYHMGENRGKNLYVEELKNIAYAYGYKTLEEAECSLK